MAIPPVCAYVPPFLLPGRFINDLEATLTGYKLLPEFQATKIKVFAKVDEMTEFEAEKLEKIKVVRTRIIGKWSMYQD